MGFEFSLGKKTQRDLEKENPSQKRKLGSVGLVLGAALHAGNVGAETPKVPGAETEPTPIVNPADENRKETLAAGGTLSITASAYRSGDRLPRHPLDVEEEYRDAMWQAKMKSAGGIPNLTEQQLNKKTDALREALFIPEGARLVREGLMKGLDALYRTTGADPSPMVRYAGDVFLSSIVEGLDSRISGKLKSIIVKSLDPNDPRKKEAEFLSDPRYTGNMMFKYELAGKKWSLEFGADPFSESTGVTFRLEFP